MCVIVDSSVASLVLAKPCHDDFKALIDWIECGAGRLVLGGDLKRELLLQGNVKRRIMEWGRSGLALQCDDSAVKARTTELEQAGVCRSNDCHVLALALITGARLLACDDNYLSSDFRDPRIINSPRGHIYRNNSHKHLLRRAPNCHKQRAE
jgi:hypothetical protein